MGDDTLRQMHQSLESLTWPALLAHWTSFAQASLALPRNAEGDRWRRATVPIIGLQACTFALGDLERLEKDAGARAAAIDKAEVLVRGHVRELNGLWAGEIIPEELDAMIQDARLAVEASRGAGVEWRVTAEKLVAEHPAELVELVLSTGFAGDLYLPVPGAALFMNSPAAFAREVGGGRPGEAVLRAVKEFLVDVTRPEDRPGLRQVYRQFDFGRGRVVRDYVVPVRKGGDVPAGQAQLVPVIEQGRAVSVNLPIPGMSSQEPVPVEFSES